MIYLATPYTLYEGGTEMAFNDACRAAGMAMRRGLAVFSPICHGHPIALHSGFPLVDADFWEKTNEPYMQICSCLLVVKMPGWQYSSGVGHEIDGFKGADKPIGYMAWPDDSIHGLRKLQEAERNGWCCCVQIIREAERGPHSNSG